MQPFAYIAPTTVEEAVSILVKYGDKAKPLAGGTDLLVQTRSNRLGLEAVVDLKNIPELNRVTAGNGLSFGATVPCCELYESPEIADSWPGLIDAAWLIGGIQIQSRAGLAGNLCNSSPSADGVCPMIVHNATVAIVGPNGDRTVAVEDFCTGPGRNVLGSDEILVRVDIPAPEPSFGAAYERFIPRNEMDIAVVGVAASVVLDGNRFKKAKIALAAVGPTPILAKEAASYLAGKDISDDNIDTAAKMASAAAKPIEDMRGTVEQRKHLVKVLTGRMLRKAVDRARG